MMSVVITVDGPSGAGKGTLAVKLAKALNFSLLDSGALYRILGLAAVEKNVAVDDEPALAELAKGLQVDFIPGESGEPVGVSLFGNDVTSQVRLESTGALASKVAPHPMVRAALLETQRNFATGKGLVADGRDMGTVVFKSAPLKVFLTASAEARAERRLLQLQAKGEGVNLAQLLDEIKARDARDMGRSESPLRPADDAILLDSTDKSIDQVFEQVMQEAQNRGLV